ncbi:MAG TPA: hypothetical protein PLT82_09580 [Candidatus Hydrogenedens sp.]|nr:hypothetical protein [Candidatus Hydrogenedens sp.]HPP59370.1 hypothetical protein [Candidatus Hydrogenedens sp.]
MTENQPIQPDWKQLKELLKECSNSMPNSAPETNVTSQSISNITAGTISEHEDKGVFDEEKKTMEAIIEEQRRIIQLQNEKIRELEEKLNLLQTDCTSHDGNIQRESVMSDADEMSIPSISELQLQIQKLRNQILLMKSKPK